MPIKFSCYDPRIGNTIWKKLPRESWPRLQCPWLPTEGQGHYNLQDQNQSECQHCPKLQKMERAPPSLHAYPTSILASIVSACFIAVELWPIIFSNSSSKARDLQVIWTTYNRETLPSAADWRKPLQFLRVSCFPQTLIRARTPCVGHNLPLSSRQPVLGSTPGQSIPYKGKGVDVGGGQQRPGVAGTWAEEDAWELWGRAPRASMLQKDAARMDSSEG